MISLWSQPSLATRTSVTSSIRLASPAQPHLNRIRKWNDKECFCFMQIRSNSIDSTNRPIKHFLMSGCRCLIRSYSHFLSGPINTPKIGLAKAWQTTHLKKKHFIKISYIIFMLYTRIKKTFEATTQFCHFVFAKIIAVWTGHCLNSDCGVVRCAWLAGEYVQNMSLHVYVCVYMCVCITYPLMSLVLIGKGSRIERGSIRQ